MFLLCWNDRSLSHNHSSSLQKLMAEGGIGRFYRGFTPCIARAAPANGIMLWTVDKANQMMKN